MSTKKPRKIPLQHIGLYRPEKWLTKNELNSCMPRISFWQNGAHSNDYKFIDSRIREMYTMGGVGVNVHKYLGIIWQGKVYSFNYDTEATGPFKVDETLTFGSPSGTGKVITLTDNGVTGTIRFRMLTGLLPTNNSTIAGVTSGATALVNGAVTLVSDSANDLSQPDYLNPTAKNIQDLLFLENRDRKYDTSVYNMRGIYNVNDLDFDLSQFGMLLQNDTIMMTFHLNEMVELLGRKLMSGDVFELQHKKDFYPLDDTVPTALKRYYVIQDATHPAEGYSITWWPHLWRVKAVPLVDSQEYADIVQKLNGDNKDLSGNNITLASTLSTFDKNIAINEAVLAQAEAETPKSGYDTSHLYVVPTQPDEIHGEIPAAPTVSPNASIQGYLTGDGIPPNGFPVISGIDFPDNPSTGDFVLRLDYRPNRLFRFDGHRWIKMEDNVRQNYTPGASISQKGKFINETGSITAGNVSIPIKEGLSQAGKNQTKPT